MIQKFNSNLKLTLSGLSFQLSAKIVLLLKDMIVPIYICMLFALYAKLACLNDEILNNGTSEGPTRPKATAAIGAARRADDDHTRRTRLF